MYKPSDITFYVPCYNVETTLCRCVASIMEQTAAPARVLLIDDGSDTPIAFDAPGVEILTHHANRGLAAARNTALAICTTPLLAAVDADVVLERDWIELALGTLNRCHAAGVGGHMSEQYNTDLADRWRATHMAQNWGDDDIENPRFLYGANTLFRAADLRRVSGYDTRLRTNDEDRTVSEALYKQGCRLVYAANARCRHLRQDSVFTVLRTYWGWHHSRGVLRGDFDTVEGLINRIFPVNLGISWYRYDLDKREGRREFVALDGMIPWIFAVRDLELFCRRTGASRPAFPSPALARHIPDSVQGLFAHDHIEQAEIPAWFERYCDGFMAALESSEWFTMRDAIDRDWQVLGDAIKEAGGTVRSTHAES